MAGSYASTGGGGSSIRGGCGRDTGAGTAAGDDTGADGGGPACGTTAVAEAACCPGGRDVVGHAPGADLDESCCGWAYDCWVAAEAAGGAAVCVRPPPPPGANPPPGPGPPDGPPPPPPVPGST